MIERDWKKKKQLCVNEDDMANVLERYSATTVLALLKEVSQVADAKFDWKEMMKNTQTGISNAREYQMLWRHLAYQQKLIHNVEDGAEPLDDDSDLEYELTAFPPVNHEATAEAAACVKVMMESSSSDSGHHGCSMVEAPLTINIPNGPLSRAPSESSKTPYSMQGKNITIPVCVQKQPVPGVTSNEGLDSNLLPRRRRKPWTEAEDMELIAAVEKCGEGNWANIIIKGDFKGDRTASQLSQRWAIIRKKKGSMNAGGNPSPAPKLSEAHLAARNANYAANLAICPPAKNITSTSSVGPGVNATPINRMRPSNAEAGSSKQSVHLSQQAGTGLNGAPSNFACPPIAEASGMVQAEHQSEQAETGINAASSDSLHPPKAVLALPKSSPVGALSLSAKSRVIAKNHSTKSVYNSDSMVKAAAVAAGARIATKSVAGSLIKSAMSSGATTHLAGHPNVHYICTGLAAPSHSSVTTRPSPPTIQRTNMISKQANAIPSSLNPADQHVKTGKEIQKDGACVAGDAPTKQVEEGKATLSNHTARLKEETVNQDANPNSNKVEGSQDTNQNNNNKAEMSQDTNQNDTKAEMSQDANQSNDKAEDQSPNKKAKYESQYANQSNEMGGSQINESSIGVKPKTGKCMPSCS